MSRISFLTVATLYIATHTSNGYTQLIQWERPVRNPSCLVTKSQNNKYIIWKNSSLCTIECCWPCYHFIDSEPMGHHFRHHLIVRQNHSFVSGSFIHKVVLFPEPSTWKITSTEHFLSSSEWFIESLTFPVLKNCPYFEVGRPLELINTVCMHVGRIGMTTLNSLQFCQKM